VIEAAVAEERFGTDGGISTTGYVTIQGVKPHGGVENAAYVVSERVSTDGGILLATYSGMGVDAVVKERVSTKGRVIIADPVVKERSRTACGVEAAGNRSVRLAHVRQSRSVLTNVVATLLWGLCIARSRVSRTAHSAVATNKAFS
jgi:hypothetical protein